jgi:ubiquinone/menaquinone biosynthesis C-methylase UbiE
MEDYQHVHNFRYDEQQRRKIQNPEQILQNIGIREGMSFVDLGCNDGFFTIPAAQIIGNTGRVYGLDINQQAIDSLKNKLQIINYKNYQLKCAKAEEMAFSDGIADIVFLGTVLHDFMDPLKVLSNAKKLLKNKGILVNLDWQKKDTKLGPPLEIRFSAKYAANLIEQAGFKIKSTANLSKLYYLIIAE